MKISSMKDENKNQVGIHLEYSIVSIFSEITGKMRYDIFHLQVWLCYTQNAPTREIFKKMWTNQWF